MIVLLTHIVVNIDLLFLCNRISLRVHMLLSYAAVHCHCPVDFMQASYGHELILYVGVPFSFLFCWNHSWLSWCIPVHLFMAVRVSHDYLSSKQFIFSCVYLSMQFLLLLFFFYPRFSFNNCLSIPTFFLLDFGVRMDINLLWMWAFHGHQLFGFIFHHEFTYSISSFSSLDFFFQKH